MDSTNKSSGGLVISEDVVAQIATTAALEIPGVAAVVAGISNIGGILRKESALKPVRINMSDGGMDIDISIQIESGHRVPEVCGELQKVLKTTLQDMTGNAINKINVYVADMKI